MPPFDLAIPTLNGGATFRALLDALRSQTARPRRLIVVDSGSDDGTDTAARDAGADLHRISQAAFDHGGTRRWIATALSDAPVLVFLTQDAVPADRDALAGLVATLTDPTIAAAYGRQLPRPGAGAAEAFARAFNYPEHSAVRSLADAPRLGLKTAFLSNSFAAWRRDALMDVGNFPTCAPFGEDTLTAGRLLRAGWKIAYVAEAAVIHSHPLSLRAEWRRHVAIGRMHAREAWLRAAFGAAEGEGMRYLMAETRHLLRHQPGQIPVAWLRNAGRYAAYRAGLWSGSRAKAGDIVTAAPSASA